MTKDRGEGAVRLSDDFVARLEVQEGLEVREEVGMVFEFCGQLKQDIWGGSQD